MHKSQTMLLEARAQMSEEEDENEAERVAIPEYGGEDIDEDAENEYGSSDEEEGEDNHRYREAIEELQAATRNIKEDQLDEDLRDKLEGFGAAIKEIRDRFGPLNASNEKRFDEVQIAAESETRRIELKFHEVEEALDKLRRQDQENREQLQTEILMMDRRLKKDDSVLNNRIDRFNDFVKEMDHRINKLTSKDSIVEGLCATLAELALIDVTLMQAEERDKQSIALLGLKEDQQSPTRPMSAQNRAHIVSIDKTCLTCSSQSYKILSAFKMACLSYFPNPVGYQDAVISRMDLIHVKKALIDQQIEKLMDFQNFNFLLTTQKKQATMLAHKISTGKHMKSGEELLEDR